MTRNPIILSAGALELQLSPSIGGAISRFEHVTPSARTPVLRESHSPLQNVLDAASFPLVPFVNRVRGGSFSFRDRKVWMAPNMAGDPNPLHGQGWLNAWAVESGAETHAILTYDHQPDEWPWAYAARQEYQLDAAGLSLRLTCRNKSSAPMPCGLGLHPYFRCGPETRIQTEVTDAWTIDQNVLPVEKVAATGRFDLSDRAVCGQDLDHGFGGWSGRALLVDPSWPFELEMSSPQARFFQLYSPRQSSIFVAEPVTHANAALNAPEEDWAELGLRVLEPGEEMELGMRLAVRSK